LWEGVPERKQLYMVARIRKNGMHEIYPHKNTKEEWKKIQKKSRKVGRSVTVIKLRNYGTANGRRTRTKNATTM
jgi:hypothetical protein